MLEDKRYKGINDHHQLCNIINRCDLNDSGHNLISHYMIRYTYENNLVFTYFRGLLIATPDGDLLHQWVSAKKNQTLYLGGTHNYFDKFEVSKVDCVCCTGNCTKWNENCNGCMKALILYRLETIWCAVLCSLNIICADNQSYGDRIVYDILNMDNYSIFKGVLGLAGYRISKKNKHSMLRRIDCAPVSFEQLTRNTEFLVKKWRQETNEVNVNLFFAWLEDSLVSCDNQNKTHVIEAPMVSTTITRQDGGKILSFRVASGEDDESSFGQKESSIKAVAFTKTRVSSTVVPSVVTYYKGCPHLCCTRQRKMSGIPFDVARSFQLFSGHFEHKHIDGTERSSLNKKPSEHYVRCLELKPFPDNDNTRPPNPHVFVADDAVSEDMKEEMINIAASQPWVKGVRGGKETFFRAATTEPTHPSLVPSFPQTDEYRSGSKEKMFPFMMIGQPRTERLYKCFDATSFEINLLRLVDNIVQITSGGSIQCHHNLISWLLSDVDKCFDFHTDANEWTSGYGVENDTYLSSQGVPLPGIEGMITFTIAITRWIDPDRAVKLTWKREELDNDNHWSIMMSGNNVHWQLTGTQAYGILHAGERALREEFESAFPAIMQNINNQMMCDDDLTRHFSSKDGNWRLVLSLRQIVSATSCPACYLQRFDMRPWLVNKPFIGDREEEVVIGPLSTFEDGENNTSNGKGSKLPKKKRGPRKKKKNTDCSYFDLGNGAYKDVYTNCETSTIMDMNISSIPTCVASGKSKADDYLSAPYVKEMLSMGYVVRVVTAPRDLSKNALRSIYEIAHTKKNQSVPTEDR